MPNLIRDELRQAGVTVEALADAVGVDKKTAHNWLNGKVMPSRRFVVALQLVGGRLLPYKLAIRSIDQKVKRLDG